MLQNKIQTSSRLHIFQAVADVETLARRESQLSRQAYELDTTHGWQLQQLTGTKDFMLRITFANERDARTMERSARLIDSRLRCGRISVQSNP